MKDHPTKEIELRTMNVIVKIPLNTVRLTLNCLILPDDSDKILSVSRDLNIADVQAARGAFLENVEDGDDYDNIYAITDAGREHLRKLENNE